MLGREFKKVFVIIAAIVLLVTVVKTVGVVKVEGNESVVKQHLLKGVVDDVWLSGTHFFFGWMWDVYKYDVGTQKCTFAQKTKAHTGEAEYSAIEVNVGENGGQSAWVDLTLNYRVGWVMKEGAPVFSPGALVSLHKDGLGGAKGHEKYKDVVIKRTVIEVVNRIARPKLALEIYSGEGYNTFVKEITEALLNHNVFQSRGILIENVAVYQVRLNPAYEAEIEAKQLAIQTTLKKKEETKAAQEEARRVFAQSQADVEKRTQDAEALKIEAVKLAESTRDANLAKASGVLAIGRAEAEVAALKREALYAGASGAWRAKVEIATARAEKLKGMLQGVMVVPEKTILRYGAETTGVVVDTN